MRKLNKFISVLMIIILLFGVVACFKNESKAATYIVKKADLYSKGEMVSFRYKNIGIGVQFVVYKKDGVEYPAYCLNKNLVGVTEEEGAEAIVNKALENMLIWRVITNGYPYKTPKELGCNSNMEAFAATKMAVYDALYTYDWKDFEAVNEQGERVIKAAEKISKIARSSNETKIIGKVEIEKVSKQWEQDNIDKKYISKTYKVKTNAESTKYTVEINNVEVEGVKITNENNVEQTDFKSNEMFKILIPIAELDNKTEVKEKFKITVKANLKTKPILYGETADENYQNYAMAGGDWEFEQGSLNDTYSFNKTCIKIVKKDAETEKVLFGARFNILDENKNIVYSDVTTNEEGIAEIIAVIPGKYYIEEVQSPEGYTKYEELIEIELGFNQTYTVNVNNYKKPVEEEKEVEDEEITVVGKQEIALPRTGF